MLGDEFQQERNVGRSNNRPIFEPLRGRKESISAKKSWCTVSHIMVTSFRSKWSAGWGSVSGARFLLLRFRDAGGPFAQRSTVSYGNTNLFFWDLDSNDVSDDGQYLGVAH